MGFVGGSDAALRSDEPGRVELLPTPCVVDRLATGEMTLEEWDESRRSQKERGVGSFGPRGDSLGAAVLRVEEGSERPDFSTTKARRGADEPGVALLPTPMSRDHKGASQSDANRHSPNLSAIDVLLPTPTASDCTGGGQIPDRRVGHTSQLIDEVLTTSWGKYAPAIARWEHVTSTTAPAPTEPNKNGNPRLSAAFSEWLMGWPAGWVTDPAIGISRNDQLRCIGNGVVSIQAAAAIRYLLAVTP